MFACTLASALDLLLSTQVKYKLSNLKNSLHRTHFFSMCIICCSLSMSFMPFTLLFQILRRVTSYNMGSIIHVTQINPIWSWKQYSVKAELSVWERCTCMHSYHRYYLIFFALFYFILPDNDDIFKSINGIISNTLLSLMTKLFFF